MVLGGYRTYFHRGEPIAPPRGGAFWWIQDQPSPSPSRYVRFRNAQICRFVHSPYSIKMAAWREGKSRHNISPYRRTPSASRRRCLSRVESSVRPKEVPIRQGCSSFGRKREPACLCQRPCRSNTIGKEINSIDTSKYHATWLESVRYTPHSARQRASGLATEITPSTKPKTQVVCVTNYQPTRNLWF